ncbi:hypothetical protein IMZ48_27385 [Candidatus Bathyarchaeota archaeon]|nr:hypothetical protein [Candidatus Bathyarchaeota archaeon]
MLVHRKAKPQFKAHHIFSPTITTTRSPLMEADFNLHKSNSTYFTDLDVSRAYLAGVLFGPLFSTGIGGRRCNLIVASVACTFRREIKLYRASETWTRIASWDDKWLYVVTHFVSGRTSASHPDILTSGARGHTGKANGRSERTVLASAVTQFVFKQGRRTVRPVDALAACGLLRSPSGPYNDKPLGCEEYHSPSLPALSSNDNLGPNEGRQELAIPAEIEAMRRANLPVVRLEKGWDKVTELFQANGVILGRHNCI